MKIAQLSQRTAEARELNEACLQAMAAANVNVDDLKDAHERLEQYNRSYKSAGFRAAATGGGA